MALWSTSPVESWMMLPPSSYCPLGSSPEPLESRVFVDHILPVWLTFSHELFLETQLIIFISPQEVGTDKVYSKDPIIKDIVRLPCGEVPRQLKILLLDRTFQRPRDHFLAAKEKSQISAWVKLILHSIRYTSLFLNGNWILGRKRTLE